MKSLIFSSILSITTVISVTCQNSNYKPLDEAKGLQVGAKAPLFTAIDQNKKQYSLEKALKRGPVVLVFYRGYWCPVCNRQLKKLQDSLDLVYAKGATLIAVSPEKPEYGKIMEQMLMM